jgi:S1-C subfamily serine protease
MRNALSATVLLASCLSLASRLAPAEIPAFFVDSVVALGQNISPGSGQPPQWQTEASGFLYGYAVDNETDVTKHNYQPYLVTNRHVLAGRTSISVKVNAERESDPVREIVVNLTDEHGASIVISHPDPSIDVSVIKVSGPFLRAEHLKANFFANDKHAADRAKMKELGTSIGDGLFVLGFPMGISGTLVRNYVIARRGSIARISDVLDGSSKTFLIDAFVFPGNSGGPVVSAVDITAIEGTKPQTAAYLIGMVKGYVPYDDVAVSQQTGRPRMVSEENSGLAEVIPVDFINETIEFDRRLHGQAPSPPAVPHVQE